MDHDRLCSWLGLPPGSWPPDHYALLGLERGSGDFAAVEDRVLERMEMLRPHQLLQPELVTEGMNRLAQAMVCLTDPVARSTYDRSLGIAPLPFEVVEDEPEPLPGAAQLLELPAEASTPAFEVVAEAEPVAGSVQAPYELVDELPAFEVVPDDEVAPRPVPTVAIIPVAGAEPVEPPPFPIQAPLGRRAVYRRLAAIRQALRAWELLRPVYGTPTEALATPVAVLLLVRALATARAALAEVEWMFPGPNSPGGTVAALVRLPHALHAVRTLLPSQRQAVAHDWRRGLDALRREQVRLRELAFIVRRRRTSTGQRILIALRRNPEWVLLFAGPAAVLVAVVLAVLRRNS